MRVGGGVDLVQVGRPVHRVGGFGIVPEPPALRGQLGLDDGQRNDVFQALERACHQRSRCPGANQRDIEMIAVRFGLKPALAGGAGLAIRCHPVAEAGRLPHERTFAIARLYRLPVSNPVSVDEHQAAPPAPIDAT